MTDEFGAPKIVDRSTFRAELDGLRVREKAHTREGDTIALVPPQKRKELESPLRSQFRETIIGPSAKRNMKLKGEIVDGTNCTT
jgi:hypothetical protein